MFLEGARRPGAHLDTTEQTSWGLMFSESVFTVFTIFRPFGLNLHTVPQKYPKNTSLGQV